MYLDWLGAELTSAGAAPEEAGPQHDAMMLAEELTPASCSAARYRTLERWSHAYAQNGEVIRPSQLSAAADCPGKGTPHARLRN
jgi:hypothetical protein